MTTKFMSNISRTFSSGGFSRTYSGSPKPFHFTKLHAAPLPPPATEPKPRRDRRRSGMAFCCCCFVGCVSILITAAIALGIAVLVLWLVLRPIHTPTYDMSDVTVSRLQYTSNRTIDAAGSYIIASFNGNRKIGIKYDSIGVDTSYQGQVFSHQDLPGLYQGHLANVTIAGNFTTDGGHALDPANGLQLQADIAKEDVPLLIRVSVNCRLKVGAITTPAFNVHVNCDVGIRPPVPAVGTTPAQPASVLRKTCKRV